MRESSIEVGRTPGLIFILDLPSVLSSQALVGRGLSYPSVTVSHNPGHPRSWIYWLELTKPCSSYVTLEPPTWGLSQSRLPSHFNNCATRIAMSSTYSKRGGDKDQINVGWGSYCLKSHLKVYWAFDGLFYRRLLFSDSINILSFFLFVIKLKIDHQSHFFVTFSDSSYT